MKNTPIQPKKEFDDGDLMVDAFLRAFVRIDEEDFKAGKMPEQEYLKKKAELEKALAS